MNQIVKSSINLFIVCILLFTVGNEVFAYEKNISKNNSSLFPPSITRTLLQLETQNALHIDFISEKNVVLKKDRSTLMLWIAPGIQSATGVLTIKTAHSNIPIDISINLPKKSENDFSIFGDMYQFLLQEKSLSCESNASSLILSTLLGKNISESEVRDNLPKSKYFEMLPEKRGETYIWGNPQEGFVGYIGHTGSIIAKQKLMTGYGVYEKPISKLFENYGLNTQILTKDIHSLAFTKYEHLTTLLEQIQKGNMVQLWADWCTKEVYDDGILSSKNELTQVSARLGISAKNTCYNVDEARELRWNYIDRDGKEKQHVGLDGQHAFVLLGWKGDIKKPTHIRVWDTDTGYHTYETGEWMRKWEKMDYKSVIIEAS